MTYVADCEWDGYNWVATVAGMPGAVTQAKRLELVAERVVEVVKLMTGDSIGPDQVVLHTHLARNLDDGADEIRRLREELGAIQATLATKQPRLIKALRRQGLTVRDIGTIVGVSHQRVQQVLGEQR